MTRNEARAEVYQGERRLIPSGRTRSTRHAGSLPRGKKTDSQLERTGYLLIVKFTKGKED